MKFFRQAANLTINGVLVFIAGVLALIAGVGHYIYTGAMWLYDKLGDACDGVDELLGESITNKN